ncbi:MAG: Ppx/GppA phosphatase family protein [Coriobacteriia bacterium]|nr:Ppx/GppA phosphatase family protein [Coriobacteriia bacterium]
MRLLQAIDIGTNSVRSIIVEVPVGGSHRVVDDEKAMTRLGQGLEASGMLDAEAVERTIVALRAMMDIGRARGVDEVRAVATEALRRASNGEEVVRRMAEEAGVEVEIISPQDEGRLVWLSAAPLLADAPFSAVVDIGGGSVEVVQAVEGDPAAIASMRLGVRVLAERFVAEDPITDVAFRRLKRHVRKTLRASVAPIATSAVRLAGSGGTVTSIAALIAGARGRRYESVHGLEIARPELMQLLAQLSHSSAADRARMPGMVQDRVDIIVPGMMVLAEVMKLFGATSVLVNSKGFRDGIVIDTLASEGAMDPRPDLIRAVRDLGARFRYDRAHADQVSRLALSLFDQLEDPLALDRSTRSLLESAALLHDVGYYVAYDRHHKHSYHLIAHSALPGLTQRERSMVAAIARYHTKALPKAGHEAWMAVELADRATVRALASLLRIADGLDRGRGERIEGVNVEDDGATTRFLVHGEGDLHAESYGFNKKKDLFEETFGRVATLEVLADSGGLF